MSNERLREAPMRSAPVPPTPAQLAGARRELARRPRPILADLEAGRLPSPVERAVRRVEDLYPAVAAAVPRLVLVAGAQQPPAGSCRWRRILVAVRVHPTRLRLDQASRLLDTPCPRCQAALGWRPKPARSSTTITTRPRTRPQSDLLARAQRAERQAAGLRRVVAAALDELGAATARRRP
jgi:hypothetical protein